MKRVVGHPAPEVEAVLGYVLVETLLEGVLGGAFGDAVVDHDRLNDTAHTGELLAVLLGQLLELYQ